METYMPPRFIYDESGRRVAYFKRFKVRTRKPIYHKAGLAARNRIAAANLGLIGRALKTFRWHDEKYEDGFQAGFFGLVRAIEKWRPGKSKLCTYATFWIRQFIHVWLEHDVPIWVPGYTREKREPRTPKEIECFAASLRARRATVALDEFRVDSLTDASLTRFDPELAEEQEVTRAIRRLGQPYRNVIAWRFFDGLKLDEIGERLGFISRERPRQIIQEAISRLRKILNVPPWEVAANANGSTKQRRRSGQKTMPIPRNL